MSNKNLLSISGRVYEVVFNPLYPLIKLIIIAFRTLLKHYGIVVSLDET